MKQDLQSAALAVRVMAIFSEIIKLKRPSGDENQLRDYIFNFIKSLENPAIKIVHYDPDATTPGDRVIVVRKAAQNGGKAEVKLVLQAHLDMVCNPSDMTFPLSTYSEEINHIKWLKACSNDDRSSTLGADDGIGVATMLAILENTTIPTGQIEYVFTVEEETDMAGAEQFDKEYLEGRTCINLDSSNDNIITYGSAGAMKSQFDYEPEYSLIPGSDTVLCQLNISGLTGGHSGSDINQGRANAIQLMARVLFMLSAELDQGNRNVKNDEAQFNIVTFFTNNKAFNAIPIDATVVVALKQKKWSNFSDAFVDLCETVKREYLATDQNFRYSFELIANPEYQTMLTAKHTGKLLALLLVIPHGVLKMEPKTDGVISKIVQTSSNLALINREKDVFRITCSHRSSSVNQIYWVRDIHRALALTNDIAISHTRQYRVWTPDPESPLLKTAQKVYAAYYGSDPNGRPLWQATIMHAGLECGSIVAKFKDDPHPMDCISIGPTIKDLHTPGESLNVNSVTNFCTCLIGILTDFSMLPLTKLKTLSMH